MSLSLQNPSVGGLLPHSVEEQTLRPYSHLSCLMQQISRILLHENTCQGENSFFSMWLVNTLVLQFSAKDKSKLYGPIHTYMCALPCVLHTHLLNKAVNGTLAFAERAKTGVLCHNPFV